MNILLPVDGSDNALKAVRQVIAMKDQYREPIAVNLLNVQSPVASGAVKMFISQQQLNDYYREEGMKVLAPARELLDKEGVAYEHHIGVGDIAATIADYSKDKRCQQIVMGARGSGGFVGALLGSTATRVAQLAEVPVTLIK
ncbi:MAG TPA: universal stress protein [Burkholderiales bacterium]|jgi:nucleotide-binding universal stress UspA family protein